jgi:methylated-DNA-[protein]-cysteine S-methyltransferase
MAKIYHQSPIGWLEIKGSDHGISSVKRVDKEGEGSATVPKVLWDCADQLAEYFDGKRQQFELAIDWSGHTEFNQSVWSELLKIPYGCTTSYSAIAETINNPKAVRAVGLANRNNPIAIIVPCHRVIAKDGDLQGYFYGLDVKMQLLQLENPKSFAEQGSLFE